MGSSNLAFGILCCITLNFRWNSTVNNPVYTIALHINIVMYVNMKERIFIKNPVEFEYIYLCI
jgi:hypothetical protein